MELVLKLPKGKLPFIGILFDSSSTAGKTNAEIVEQFSKEEFEVLLEHTQTALNLRLICKARVMVYFYNHLSIAPEKLKSWLYITRDMKLFNFGHIYKELDDHKLAISSPGRKPFVVKVVSLKIMAVEDDSEYNLPFGLSNGKW